MRRFATTFVLACVVALSGAFCGCRMFQRRTNPQQGLKNFVTYYKGELDSRPRTRAQIVRHTCRVEISRAKSLILTIDETTGRTVDSVPLLDEYEVTLSGPVRYGPDGGLLGSEPVRVTIRDPKANLSESFVIQ